MNTHDCEHIKSLFSGYIDEELDAQQRQEVKEHIESCAACKKEFEAFYSMTNMLQSMEKINAPDDFTQKVNQRIDDKKSVDLFLTRLLKDERFKVPLTICAALMLFVCVRAFYPEILFYKSGQGKIADVKSDKAQTPDKLVKAREESLAKVSDAKMKPISGLTISSEVSKSSVSTKERYGRDETLIVYAEKEVSAGTAKKQPWALRADGYNAATGDSKDNAGFDTVYPKFGLEKMQEPKGFESVKKESSLITGRISDRANEADELAEMPSEAAEEKINKGIHSIYILRISSLNIDKTRTEIIDYINAEGIKRDLDSEQTAEKPQSIIISITTEQFTDLIAALNQQQADISSMPEITGLSSESFLLRIDIDEKK